MDTKNLQNQIAELEAQIEALPKGSVAKKSVNGKTYYYHRYNENSKRTEKYIDFDSVDALREQIDERKALEAKLKELKKKAGVPIKKPQKKETLSFYTSILTGDKLKKFVADVKNYKKRECYTQLHNFVYGDIKDRVFILYGLRRTGKTTMIRQLIADMLGDVLLQVVLHAQIAKDNNNFDIEDVAKELGDKLIHRHPHVFGNKEVHSTEEILQAWEELKKEEKTNRKSVLDGISKSQSALMAAQKISKKVVKVGFEWDSVESLKKCIESEYKEFEEAVELGEKDKMEDEMGDIFFATVNLARWYKIDAEQALLRANKKFTKRFRKMEELATKPLEEYSYEEYDQLWRKAKSLLLD